MLLFKREHVEPILARRKTQTRRQGNVRWKVGSVHEARTNMSAGSTFAYLTIRDVRRERVRDITLSDVRAEGYRTKAAFLEGWRNVGGDPADECWVIEFTADESRPEGRLAERGVSA